MLQELYAIFTLLRQNITFSNFVFVFFFYLLLLNGITKTPVLGPLLVFQSLRKKYLISKDLAQVLSLIITILKKLNLLQDLGLV